MADQQLDNRGLDEAIATRAEEIGFGRLLAAEGLTTVALDAAGNMVRHFPDGIKQVIAQAPPGAPGSRVAGARSTAVERGTALLRGDWPQ